ncbi:MAG: 4Fe-4S dicluster domain-containing protein [Candidatus Omnitrophota bacterium]|nr:4Fe-4S binding protein [Candidatus Omnitrophota bacterium]MBU1929294.1 4Fe-4S binding protein [Candidatus Omnitrophota bacterium]MBU2035586.1 4Fe-4S binding protein [Candidatus Omnitrophota bacterium]MBU2222162.1 4Fe-4S binding protein [Candidatus Omnitrophota bacterium]
MKRLYIDLDICNNCKECRASCSYLYHPQNNGVTSLREYATFTLFCRHCEEAPCVNSCYHDALEKQPDGILKRYNMRCTSCKSCVIACPFGTILTDFIPYLDSRCDFCITKADAMPVCVTNCPEKAIEVREVEENIEQNIYFIGNTLAVCSRKWLREDIQPKKK